MHGVLQVALAEIGVTYSTIPVQTWRKFLGVKKTSEGDFKIPTKEAIKKYVDIPDKIESNVTGNLRATPFDVTDSLGIAIGSLKKLGFENLDFSDLKIQENIDIV